MTKLKQVSTHSRKIKKKYDIKPLLNIAKNTYRSSLVILAVLASIFTITGGVLTLQNFDQFKSWYNQNFLTKQYWLDAANSLSPEVNANFFDEQLGKPAFTSKYNGLENRTYVNDYFYTQAFVDDSKTVRLFSITIRKSDFNPSIPYLLNKNKDPYKLGKITFGNARKDFGSPLSTQYIPGAHRSIYSEMYYEGNPGNYLYYFLTLNDSGINGFIDFGNVRAFTFEDTGLFKGCDNNVPLLGNWDQKSSLSDRSPSLAIEKSKGLYPNTITVTDRDGSIFCEYKDFFKSSKQIILGPNLDKVILLRQ